MNSERLIALGVIASAHGIRGQVKIRSFTADPRDITAYGPLKDHTGRVYKLTIAGQNKDMLFASIEGITDRDAAEALRNIELFVPRDAFPEPQEHEYYHEDLVGLEILTPDGKLFGTILAVHNFGAGDLLSVKLVSGKEEFYPFTRSIFPEINIAKKIAIIEPPAIISDD